MLLDKEEAQIAIADINQYSGWKVSLYYSRKKIEQNTEEGKTDTKEKNKKKNKLVIKVMTTVMMKQ